MVVKCRGFTLIGITPNFAESSERLNTYSHSVAEGCNLCTFRKEPASARRNSGYMYSTSIHSKNPSYQRSVSRQTSLKKSSCTRKELKFLGIHETGTEMKEAIIQLHLVLQQLKTNVKTWLLLSLQYPFAPFICNVVAHDHCIVGILRYFITCVFSCAGSINFHWKLNVLIRNLCQDNGLQCRRNL